ncbi:site-specific integrase [Kitasatospora sp. NPDC050543]|uniref:site-specific integrase n=1 Tax=Kitasatospora sp. NPDC050543 TaxID=3364054 RepID=UPI0037A32F99
MNAQDRARRASTRPRSDHTLETALSTMRDLAIFLTAFRGKNDWALVDVHDIEAFLTTLARARKRRLTVLRQFFRFARSHRIVLIDPTRDLAVRESNGFRGRTLTLDQQRGLFQRWTTDESVHPHEALVGILALLATLRNLTINALRAAGHHNIAAGLRHASYEPFIRPLDLLGIA